jgi:hypothetical protein
LGLSRSRHRHRRLFLESEIQSGFSPNLGLEAVTSVTMMTVRRSIRPPKDIQFAARGTRRLDLGWALTFSNDDQAKMLFVGILLVSRRCQQVSALAKSSNRPRRIISLRSSRIIPMSYKATSDRKRKPMVQEPEAVVSPSSEKQILSSS